MITLANQAHPGEVLDELLFAIDLSAGALARKLGVPRARTERLVKGGHGADR
jgi:plasmid maintenance system antidote protein VapI